MNIKHLLIISFIFSNFVLSAQKNNIIDSILIKDKVTIHNLNVNSENQDFGTAYYINKIVFTSSRTTSEFIKRIWKLNDLPFLNLYVAEKENSELINIKPFNKNINKKYNEGPASFNEAGDFTAFTRNNYNGKSKDDKLKLQIYTSSFANKTWTDAKPFEYNSNEYSVGHPALTADGNTMYFASDMPGGFGGVDLYVTHKKDNGKWSKPLNLGNKINTAKNEMFPFIHKNNYLFFASNGHGSHGGLDIFFSEKKEIGFTVPKDLASPLNSKKDDFAFIIDKNMNKGYFSSNREGGKGDDDIYSFILKNPVPPSITLKGKTLDADNTILANTAIQLFDKNDNKINSIISDGNGFYNFTLQPDKNYKLKAGKEKYKSFSSTVDTHTADTLIIQNIVLEKITEPLYDFNFVFNVIDKTTKEPVANTKIILNNNLNNKKVERNTDVNGIGNYKLEKLKSNEQLDYTFTFEKDRYDTKSADYKTEIHESGNYVLNIELQKPEIIEVIKKTPSKITLKGKTLDADNTILANTAIQLFDKNDNKINSIISDGNGFYNFTLQPDKNYKLKAGKEKYKSFSSTVDTHTADTLIIQNIVLEKIPEPLYDFNFVFNIIDKTTKEPIANTKIILNNSLNNKKVERNTDENGACNYKLEKLKSNEQLDYTFTFEKDGYDKKSADYKTEIHESGNYVLNIELQKPEIVDVIKKTPSKITLKGKTLDTDNTILANTAIQLSDENDNEINSIITDENGFYNFTLQPDKNYKLKAGKEKYKSFSSTVDTHTADTLIIQNIVLEKIPKPLYDFNFVFNVIDKTTKEPIANTKIILNNNLDNKKVERNTDVNGTGNYKLEKLKSNEQLDYTFTFEKDGYDTKSADYKTEIHESGNYVLNIELQKPEIVEVIKKTPSKITLKGKTLDTDNTILANTAIQLSDENDNEINSIITDENGFYNFTLQPDKNYKLKAGKDGFKSFSSTIDTHTADTLITQNIVLEKIPEPLFDFSFVFNVIDKETKEPIANTKITLNNNLDNKKVERNTDVNGTGNYKLEKLKSNEQLDYTFTFEKDGYDTKSADYKTNIRENGNYVLNIELQKSEIVDVVKKTPSKITLKGKVYDNDNKILSNTTINLYDINGNKIKIINTNENGEYNFTLQSDTVFQKDEKYIMNFKMRALNNENETNEIIKIKPVYFDYDKSEIRPDAAIELDKIIKIMNQNPDMVIELSSFTDCRGASSYNKNLSEERAKATLNYIRKRISNPSRISGKGLGETNFINDCDCDENNNTGCSEEELQQNRRTEFKIIKK